VVRIFAALRTDESRGLPQTAIDRAPSCLLFDPGWKEAPSERQEAEYAMDREGRSTKARGVGR
jgi:hypothetical protein